METSREELSLTLQDLIDEVVVLADLADKVEYLQPCKTKTWVFDRLQELQKEINTVMTGVRTPITE